MKKISGMVMALVMCLSMGIQFQTVSVLAAGDFEIDMNALVKYHGKGGDIVLQNVDSIYADAFANVKRKIVHILYLKNQPILKTGKAGFLIERPYI